MRNKLLNILPICISITIVLIAFIIVLDEPKVVYQEKVHVVWTREEAEQLNSTYKASFETAIHEPSSDTSPIVQVYAPEWIRTNDSGLVNYAKPPTLLNCKFIDKLAPVEIPEVVGANQKSYMRYQALGTESWNRQGWLSRCPEAYTDERGIRCVDGRKLIAVGSYYCSTIGTYMDVFLEDGTVIPCMMGDMKADKDTDQTNRYARDMSVIEFVIDAPKGYREFQQRFPEALTGNYSVYPEYQSAVVGLRIYDKVYDIELGGIN